MYRPNLKFVALPVPEIIAIDVLGGVANPQYWTKIEGLMEKRRRYRESGWYRSKERW